MIKVNDIKKDLDVNIRSDLNDFIIYKMGERNITDMHTNQFEELASEIMADVYNKIKDYYSFIGDVEINLTPQSMREICSSISR